MAKQNVTDESGPTTGDDSEASFVKGYQASDPRDATTGRPGWDNYGAPGDMTVPYKKFWSNKPRCFPNGAGDDGTA
jgi:hypothetical protein